MQNQQKMNFPGIGESSYIEDPELGPIPLIDEGDSEEMKEKKNEYSKRKIEELSKSTGMSF